MYQDFIGNLAYKVTVVTDSNKTSLVLLQRLDQNVF